MSRTLQHMELSCGWPRLSKALPFLQAPTSWRVALGHCVGHVWDRDGNPGFEHPRGGKGRQAEEWEQCVMPARRSPRGISHHFSASPAQLIPHSITSHRQWHLQQLPGWNWGPAPAPGARGKDGRSKMGAEQRRWRGHIQPGPNWEGGRVGAHADAQDCS